MDGDTARALPCQPSAPLQGNHILLREVAALKIKVRRIDLAQFCVSKVPCLSNSRERISKQEATSPLCMSVAIDVKKQSASIAPMQ
jgi:hypothetical protein